MARDYTKVLLITANVGSIFEDPENMLQMWLREFLTMIQRLDPDFLAVHCQEVGGKNYEESMQHVNLFIKTLLASKEMQQFDKARVFLDEDFTAIDKFTALGSLYFIHQSIQNVQLWDWIECKYVPVIGREVLSGNIETVTIKEKAKFPQEFFPESKWSRKGFLRTRWNLCNTVFDLINIHLFHDASNIIAMESSPSVYCENRKRAMLHTLQRFENDSYDCLPYIMFGDFNFRLDTHELIKKLTEKLEVQYIRGKKNDINKILYTSPQSGRPVLTIEKKGFDYHEHHTDFSNNNNKWLHAFDQEPSLYEEKVFEYGVTFPPSYPFSENIEDGNSYMKTRCPSWCDRILLSKNVQDIIYHPDGNDTQPDYNIIGPNICMGDHKPVYLNFKLRQGAGKSTVQRCSVGQEDYPPPSPSSPTTTTAAASAIITSDLDGSQSPSSPSSLSSASTSTSSVEMMGSPSPSSPLPPDAPEDVAAADDGADPQKRPLRKVISINGEEVDSSDMDHVNIHDFATFEQEAVITRSFFSTIRRRTGDSDSGATSPPSSPTTDQDAPPASPQQQQQQQRQSPLASGSSGSGTSSSGVPASRPFRRQPSFREVAREVVQKELVLLALKHYSHRSDSESEAEDDEEEAETDEELLPPPSGSGGTSLDSVFLTETAEPGPRGPAVPVEQRPVRGGGGAPDSRNSASSYSTSDLTSDLSCSPVCAAAAAAAGGDGGGAAVGAGAGGGCYARSSGGAGVLSLDQTALRTAGVGAAGSAERVLPGRQVKIAEVDSTKYIHVRQNGASVRVFRETSV